MRHPPLKDRLMAKVEMVTESGCWIFMGVLNDGYGYMGATGRTRRAHRISYELYRGLIPPGLDLDHLCRVRCCVNPWHLEPVTERENTLRSPIAVTAVHSRKTHCSKGHPFSGDNLHIRPNGGRRCKTCARDEVVAKYWRGRTRQRDYPSRRVPPAPVERNLQPTGRDDQ